MQTDKTGFAQHPKIGPLHLERLAYIYVRQSSPKQVAHNQESQLYQRRLHGHALELGWPEDRIRTLDSDLGVSGREAAGRVGFQELVAEISLGHVGIVFGYEVSRLARNNSDWYHLLDLAAVFGTLIADSDGIYDPRLYNDRLLLGLKGTMSEAELHLLRQRLEAGRMTQVKRGAYRQCLPTGYVRLPNGTVVQDPDDQVRHVIELTFTTFAQLGSVTKVIRYLRHHGILLPRRQRNGPQVGELLWKVASEAAVSDLLKNPAYAGTFAYGRRQADPTRQQPGRPATGHVHKPMSQWLHVQHDVYPAYITWAQYLANQERIRANGLRFVENRERAQGIVREGPGILQGLTVCGSCGHHMQTVYKHTPRYVCHGLSRTIDAPCVCTSVRAPLVDEIVVAAFFEAIGPAQLDALDAILEAQREDRAQLERQWQERRKRAGYEARLAQRQYDAVDPDNRLVAGELERRWEEKLRQVQQTEEAYDHFQQTPWPDRVPPPLRALFREVNRRLPELWPALSNSQKKELLRSLISQVIITRPVPERIDVRIVWISGCYTDRTTRTPILCERDLSGYEPMVERLRVLWEAGCADEQIAETLTSEGFHGARMAEITPERVMRIRLDRKWYQPLACVRGVDEVDGYLTARGLAKRLAVNGCTVYRFIYDGIIPPALVERHPEAGVYLIRKDEGFLEQLEQRVRRNKQARA